MANQSIKCSVDTCKYNSATEMCTLENIHVGCENTSPYDKKETECDSFECK